MLVTGASTRCGGAVIFTASRPAGERGKHMSGEAVPCWAYCLSRLNFSLSRFFEQAGRA